MEGTSHCRVGTHTLYCKFHFSWVGLELKISTLSESGACSNLNLKPICSQLPTKQVNSEASHQGVNHSLQNFALLFGTVSLLMRFSGTNLSKLDTDRSWAHNPPLWQSLRYTTCEEDEHIFIPICPVVVEVMQFEPKWLTNQTQDAELSVVVCLL